MQGTYNTYIDLTKYVPTWRGHAFIGWYSERSLTNKVSGVCLTKDMTVYAGWRVDENPGTGVNPFTDISEKDWFYGDVMFVYENGLMLGTSKTLFSPHETAMRGMMATILWRMEGSPVPKGKNSFTDVEAGSGTLTRSHGRRRTAFSRATAKTSLARTIPSPVNSLQPSSTATQTTRATI